jgi:hypothetical protein
MAAYIGGRDSAGNRGHPTARRPPDSGDNLHSLPIHLYTEANATNRV